MNKLRSGLKVCFVKSPSFEESKEYFIASGRELITEDVGNSLEKDG
jgi:hypothetical protein